MNCNNSNDHQHCGVKRCVSVCVCVTSVQVCISHLFFSGGRGSLGGLTDDVAFTSSDHQHDLLLDKLSETFHTLKTGGSKKGARRYQTNTIC